MLNLTIELLVYSAKNNSLYLLSTSEDELSFPAIDISNLNPVKLMDRGKEFFIQELFAKHVHLDYRWVNLKLIDYDVASDGTDISTRIFYSCMIPFDTSLRDCFWINADNLFKTSAILKKILL